MSENIPKLYNLPLRTGEAGFVVPFINDVLGSCRAIDAYISTIDQHAIKPWRRHRASISNLYATKGVIKIVVYSQMTDSFHEYTLDHSLHQLLVIPPSYWFAMQNLCQSPSSMINFASLPYDLMESDKRSIDFFPYIWT